MLESMIRQIFKEKKASKAPFQCPDAEMLAGYLDKTLSEDKRNSVEGHLVSCDSCLSQVVCCATARPVAQKSRLRKNSFDIVIRCCGKALELVENLETVKMVLAPPLVSVRGATGHSGTNLCFQRQFGTIIVEIEVEWFDGDTGELRVQVMDGRKPIDALCISLFKNENEIESCTTRNGAAIFENVAPGAYHLVLNKRDVLIGKISMSLEKISA